MYKNKFYIFIMILVFVIAMASFYFIRGISMPDNGIFEDNETSNTDNSALPKDEDRIIASINSENNESVNVYPEITSDTVKQLIEKIEMPTSFCWYFKSSLYSSNKSITESGTVKFDDGNYKIEIFDSSINLKKTIIEENDVVFVQIGNESSEFSSLFTNAFEEAGVPGINDFIRSDTQDFTYSLVESDYGTLIYAEFENVKEGYSISEKYYISLDYGIVVRADCYENGRLVYMLETTALYELYE